MYLRVVQSCKDAFFGDPQTSRQYGKIQAVVGFQCIAQQVADKTYHFIVISCPKCFIKWNIIFINQQDDFLSIVLFEKQGKSLETVNQRIIRHGIFRIAFCLHTDQLIVRISIIHIQFRTFAQETESSGLIPNDCSQCCHR